MLAAVAPKKLAPLIEIEEYSSPLVGVKEVITGFRACSTVNVPADIAVPPCVVTDILPVDPKPTKAVIMVSHETAVVLLQSSTAVVPPNFTAVVVLKLNPFIVTMEPGLALAGLKEVITGAAGLI
jgi:hypothetical protein